MLHYIYMITLTRALFTQGSVHRQTVLHNPCAENSPGGQYTTHSTFCACRGLFWYLVSDCKGSCCVSQCTVYDTDSKLLFCCERRTPVIGHCLELGNQGHSSRLFEGCSNVLCLYCGIMLKVGGVMTNCFVVAAYSFVCFWTSWGDCSFPLSFFSYLRVFVLKA